VQRTTAFWWKFWKVGFVVMLHSIFNSKLTVQNVFQKDSSVLSIHCCSVLQCVAVCCSVLQCAIFQSVSILMLCCSENAVAVCCSALQCVAVCCSVLQCAAVQLLRRWCLRCWHFRKIADCYAPGKIVLQHTTTHTHCNTLQNIATHCNTLQCTAAHCSTLQHTATHQDADTLER